MHAFKNLPLPKERTGPDLGMLVSIICFLSAWYLCNCYFLHGYWTWEYGNFSNTAIYRRHNIDTFRASEVFGEGRILCGTWNSTSQNSIMYWKYTK